MDLFIIRHGIAEEVPLGRDDASRELTAVGEHKVRRVVQGLRELGWRFDRVLTSPWPRAARTAELLAPICTGKPIASELLCQPPTQELLAQIAEVVEAPHRRHGTAVVGHEPWLGELVGWLVFGDLKIGHAIDLKKAGIAWLEGNAVPGGMTLRALLPPKISRALR
jgi:phosphohistidine phosphatase